MTQRAKNIILIISDGQGYNGWLAADYFEAKAGRQGYQMPRPDGTVPVHVAKAQRASYFVDQHGNEVLADEQLLPEAAVGVAEHPYRPEDFWQDAVFEQYGGHSMDSAASATALASGRWTSNGRLNISWDGLGSFDTVVDVAKSQHKKTGVITTVQASHATPAGMVARQARRGSYDGIFQQMLEQLDLIMGCGHPLYDNDSQAFDVLPEGVWQFLGGEDYFQAVTSGELGATFIDQLEQFQSYLGQHVNGSKLVAIPRAYETLQQRRQQQVKDHRLPSGMAFNALVPDIDLMTRVALHQLGHHQDGFFLLIEAGAVDWAHHVNDLSRAIEEQLALNKAIDSVMAWVEQHSSWQESLMIVTADHETGALWGESMLPDQGKIDPDCLSTYLMPIQNHGRGRITPHHYHVLGHSNNLVPLWALGVGSESFLDRDGIDPIAARLWGEAYGWDGRFVEAVRVFDVMKAVMTGS